MEDGRPLDSEKQIGLLATLAEVTPITINRLAEILEMAPSDGRFGWQFTFVDLDGYAITIYDRDAPAEG